jgi:fructose-bisphosphate aldolase / 6-deoxy-5-ketofructose 1-phosphate synthase
MDDNINIPADVPNGSINEYYNNYELMTYGSGNLMLFAGDQKVEHLNDDFYGDNISPDDNDPEHLFKIADSSDIGVFAAQMGLISMYGPDFPEVPYLVKLNSKTHLIPKSQRDPISLQLMDVEQVVEFKRNSGLDVLGIGYTIYLGSEYEHLQLREAAQAVYKAHQAGMLSVLWIYPRGKAVSDEKAPQLIAGACGVAATLGADFVKVNPAKKDGASPADLMIPAVKAAGKTKVICAGGSSTDPKAFLQALHDQIHVAGISGNATGRNIHQKPFEEAVRMCNAISAITVHEKSVEEAIQILEG